MFVAGYGKTVSHVNDGLKSAKETKQLKLDPPFYEWVISKLKNMSLPKGDVHKKKEMVQDVTLHDLDVANAQGGQDVYMSFHDGTADDEVQENWNHR